MESQAELVALKQWATPRQIEYIDAIERHNGNVSAAAKELNVARGTIANLLEGLKRRAARMGHSPAHDMTHAVPDGFHVKGVSTYYNAEGKAAGQWVKSSIDHERQLEIIRETISELCTSLPRCSPIAYSGGEMNALCNLVVFTDYHLGMLAWHKEGGADWDLKIAERLLVSSFLHMVQAAPKAGKCVLAIQGDFLHTDGLLPVTPAHKNVLDADSRYSKIVASAIRVIRHLVDYALERHAEVHLILCEGNHDEAGSIWLRQMFGALYENEPRLTVNDSELPFYVHQHGDVMLCFHHGHKVKNEALPMLFAAQYPKIWGATAKRYCHTGHRHHVDEKEYSGITVVQHPTLAARDAYAARGGWISERAAQVITYHSKFGQVARNYVAPEMFE
ncbi:helix-turn-helix domain-containing protein [Burkholderia cenocepacia]|uniref:helix-turn-helix domain-containing protein n=1 Tax=Burkholderia cenocepacia TaxID=95486 RepID=UPI002B23FDA1|nr:helix-turn-helix domain-containing protein [Burkholderia cenocepacia]MEB2554062.1 helix-turn-helix domain-containing protein [Burkholderia cenocepacia]